LRWKGDIAVPDMHQYRLGNGGFEAQGLREIPMSADMVPEDSAGGVREI
jgi:hypothetical protein